MAADDSFTLPPVMHPVRQFLRREYRRASIIASQTRATLASCTRTGRLALLAGNPSRKELLVIPSANYDTGLFAAFASVLGLLEHYDNWRRYYAGVQVDFGTRGLYYDPSAGNNWWDYFFELVDFGATPDAPKAIISDDEQIRFAKRVERTMPREVGFRLIDRYIRIKQHLRDEVDSYVRDKFGSALVIGIHYRGTDKFEDAPRVPYDRVHAAVLEVIDATAPLRCKLFVATDEQAFLDYARDRFPGRVHCLEMHRSTDGSPIDILQVENRRKGKDAVMDCLLLSRCDRLVRTASNLSLCSTLFNPHMPVVLLNRE